MGKGDRKTRKGKIAIRSYGNSRPHKAGAAGAAGTRTVAARKTAVTRPAPRKAAPAKKTAAKKPA